MVHSWVVKKRRRFSSVVEALGVCGAFAMLVASNLAATTPLAGATAKAAGGTADCNSVTTCYTPEQLEVAYGVAPLLQRGIDGRGETVVLPELAESQLSPPQVTDLRLDFAAFDRLFHLPAPSLKVVSTFPNPSHPWFAFGEEVLDAEIVHAIAPRASLTILLVKETSLDNTDNAVAASVAALRSGASEGGIISISAAAQVGGEHCVDRTQVIQLDAALEDDVAHHVTVVAATGDVGAAGEPCALITALGGTGPAYTPRKEVILVASDPLVLSVGGTTLDASHTTGAWIGETAWGLPDGDPGSFFQASGGGFSHLFARPSYQSFRSSQPMRAGNTRLAGTPARAPPRPPGPGSSPSPTSTRSATSALSTRRSTRSLAVRNTTRPSTTSRWATTRPSSPLRRSPATAQGRAGTPLPAGGAQTLRYLCPCSRDTRESPRMSRT
ncbi:MAG: hypothetical protein ABSB52_16285 [Acidimicrobiales bacterium]